MDRKDWLIFSGNFESEELARDYFIPYWEPEPDENATDEEYYAWESRNPIWKLEKQLGKAIDPCFTEFHGDFYSIYQALTPVDQIKFMGRVSDVNRYFLIIQFDAIENGEDLISDLSSDKISLPDNVKYLGAYRPLTYG